MLKKGFGLFQLSPRKLDKVSPGLVVSVGQNEPPRVEGGRGKVAAARPGPPPVQDD